MAETPVTTRSTGLPRAWFLATAVALIAWQGQPMLQDAFHGSRFVPSTAVMALLFGMLAGLIPRLRSTLAAALKAVSKQAIPIAIIAIGFELDLDPLLESGQLGISVVLVLIAIPVAFGASMLFGKLCGLDPRASMLLGAGTAICGNSAIMAVAPTVDAKDEDLGLAIGVINLLGVLMVIVLPPAVTAFGVTGTNGGALAGLTVHAVPQAIATGGAFGSDAAVLATVFKLMRVVMLAPMAFVLAFALRRIRGQEAGQGKGTGMPWFVILFVVAAGIRAFGWVDSNVTISGDTLALWGWLRHAGKFLLAVALAAIGMGLDIKALVQVGPRVLVAGTMAIVTMVAALVPLVLWLL